MSERFYIHYADDTNRQLMDTESDFNIHIEEIYSEEELIQLCNLLNELNDENKTLKAQLYCEGSVCNICKHQQLTPDKVMQGYYTSKCEKGHKACSKEDLKHCKDFKLEGLSE